MKLKAGVSVKRLTELYVRGIDFCIQRDYPTLDFMRDHFRGECEPYGVFVDDEVAEPIKNRPDVVLNGDCKAVMEYDGYTVSRVFIRHNGQAAINVSDHAMVTIDAFDNAKLVVAASGENAQIMVNIYGDAQVECIGLGIKVKSTNKKTY